MFRDSPVGKLLSELVACDTTSARPNDRAIDLLCAHLEPTGVRCERIAHAAGSSNLLARVEPISTNLVDSRETACGPRTAGLLLSAHIDCVPADPSEWRSDPFTLTERAGRLYGRGTTDMKGFVALAAEALRQAAASGVRRPLALLISADEELGSVGLERLVQHYRGPLPRAVIVGEPTQEQVVGLHKGHLKLRIVIRGREAHSGTPHLGRSAIEPAGAVLVALAELRRRMELERAASSGYFPEAPFPVLNVGRVSGGTALNVIPGQCVVELGVRLLPGMDASTAIERVRAAVAGAMAGDGPDWRLDVIQDNPPLQLDESAEIVRAALDSAEQSAPQAAPFASDAGFLQRFGCQCVLMGPGTMADAHQPDESIAIEQLERGAERLRDMIQRMCGTVS